LEKEKMSEITHEISLENFQEQFDYVLTHYKKHGKSVSNYSNIIIAGLGGSGIGGRIARSYFWNHSPVPVEGYSDYHLPAYASNKTLTILCSYSGNTEETLTMFAEAQERGCDIICMAAGGKLMELATAAGYPTYTIATGYQPRMTLGFALGNLLMIVGEVLSKDLTADITALRDTFKNPTQAITRAKEMHTQFKETISQKFVVISDMAFEPVGIRFCQQIQENAKGEGFVSVLPEANHNMIESYYEKHDTNFILLNSRQNDRVTKRFDFVKKVLTDLGNNVYEYPLQDASLNSIFEVIHSTDWLSIYASDDKKVNNMEVGIIMELKGFLSNQ